MSSFYNIGAEAVPLPIPDNILGDQHKDDKVCVVSILGKGNYKAFTSKATPFNTVLDADIFTGVKQCLKDSVNQGEIECYYDAERCVVYLHHTSIVDTFRLSAVCSKLKDAGTNDFQSLWQQEECHSAKCLLFLFHVSHLIVISHPGPSFDITYVRLFRILDTIRMKVQKTFSEQLLDLPVSKDWKFNARPCSPRVLFVFEAASMEFDPNDLQESPVYRSKPQKLSPLKRLQHCMEDQIYKILRKSRVITNISNNSLFAVPANQEFVYLHVTESETADPVTYFLQQIRNNSTHSPDGNQGYQSGRRGAGQAAPTSDQSRGSPVSRSQPDSTSFSHFLSQHVNMALTKGFDDNVGRHPVAANFELSTSETWFTLANRLYVMLFAEKLDPKIQPHCNTLKSLLETDLRFSENRCNKVLPLAEAAYQENLPTHYIKAYHLSKLAQARKVFGQFGRGPACEKYLGQLEDWCEKFWRDGRQLCEDVSLTGNHCVNPLHRTEDERETEANSHLPVMLHASPLKMKAACNCGRTLADKDDPFNHKAANYDFYLKLEETCCGELEHYGFPVFEASSGESRAAALGFKDSGKEPAGGATPSVSPGTTGIEGGGVTSGLSRAEIATATQGMNTLSLALSLGQSGGSDMFGHGGQSNCSPLPDHDAGSNVDPTEAATTTSPAPTRQHSTIEYLPGMIHTDSPAGLLPKYPSWSLLSMGSASLYNHNQGIDLPGFLTGSNFLLPWDKTVTTERDRWPSVGESSGKKQKQKKASRGKELTEVTVRVYLGVEYECPRGHRFFCSGPEKIIKVSSTSTVKDNANKLVNMDMPLYCPCHCRSSKGYMAQLMRIYIVTPDGPLQVGVNPLVQPAPPPCPTFHPGVGAEIDLTPGQIWVLRLPSVYMGDQGPYTIPTDAGQLPVCRLLKGTFNFREVTGAD